MLLTLLSKLTLAVNCRFQIQPYWSEHRRTKMQFLTRSLFCSKYIFIFIGCISVFKERKLFLSHFQGWNFSFLLGLIIWRMINIIKPYADVVMNLFLLFPCHVFVVSFTCLGGKMPDREDGKWFDWHSLLNFSAASFSITLTITPNWVLKKAYLPMLFELNMYL